MNVRIAVAAATLLTALAAVRGASPALAQPGASAPTSTASGAPASPPAPQAAPAPQPQPTSPQPTSPQPQPAAPSGAPIPVPSRTVHLMPPPSLAAAPGDPTVAQYEAAFAAFTAGRAAEAAAAFDQIAALSPDPLRAASARELARLAHALADQRARYSVTTAEVAAALGADDGDEGRATFVTTTTLLGLYAGVVAVVDADVRDARARIATVTLGATTGLVGSYLATRGARMTGAMSDAYALGISYGLANAGLLMGPLGSASSSESVHTALLLSGAAGGLAGLGYATSQAPTRGQVSFAGTVGLLGLTTTWLGLAIAQPDIDGDTVRLALAGGMDAGLVAGFAVGRDLDWSLARSRIVGLGTLLGGLTGATLGALMINGSDDGDAAVATLAATMLAGTWGGFALTTVLSKEMRPDRRYTPGSQLSLTAMPVRAGAGLALAGSF